MVLEFSWGYIGCKFCRGCQKSTIRLEKRSLSIQEMCYLCKRNWSAKWSIHSQFVKLCCTPVKQEIKSNIAMEHEQAFLLCVGRLLVTLPVNSVLIVRTVRYVSIQEMCYLCKRNWSGKWSFHSQLKLWKDQAKRSILEVKIFW